MKLRRQGREQPRTDAYADQGYHVAMCEVSGASSHRIIDRRPFITLEIGQGKGARTVRALIDSGAATSAVKFSYFVLNACANARNVEQGMLVHGLLIQSGLKTDNPTENSLIDMYMKCGSLEDARKLFLSFSHLDVVAWSAFINGSAQNGRAEEALQLFWKMLDFFLQPNHFTFACALKGMFMLERFVPGLELVTWSISIGQYTKFGRASEALDMFSQMMMQGIKPDRVIFTVVLNACANAQNFEQGMLVHGLLIQSGLKTDNPTENSLIDMYMKCGSLEDARKLFLSFSHLDVVAWSAFINGSAQNGRAEEALQLFWKMLDFFLQPNHFTFACALKGMVHEEMGVCEKERRGGKRGRGLCVLLCTQMGIKEV
ncbi:hypothetical protein KP509_24G001400 [Ceratopteris richardii]|uniref:Pentatricopeptide repeat-containing protein n=1 Tax=Ceratopteris richardii TaxID=49495 RepID=A0A8T2RS35_CERRI|nr:hypothetical protein KP509_24G001400 [Ceratopteris richardii]